MKITGNAILNSKNVNGRNIYYLKIREYEKNGDYKETELYCRLTKKVQELVETVIKNCGDLEIEIKESFYSVDNYYKGEQIYTKPTLVISELEIV